MDNRILSPAEISDFNRSITSWGKNTRSTLIFAITRLDLRGRIDLESGQTHLVKSIKTKFKKKDGQIYATSFSFARHGIFLEIGVGKGRKKGSGKETPRPWLATTLFPAAESLADIVAEKYADNIANTKIFAPGIIKGKTIIK